MHGDQVIQSNLFSYADLESRISEKHQIRRIKKVVDKALSVLSDDFDEMYSHEGRPSIPPEQSLRALLLQIFFSIRSERQLMERINYDLLFRWFVGISMDAEVWEPGVIRLANASGKESNMFGWLKDVGLMRKLGHRSRVKVSWIFRFTSAAYNIVRLQKLLMEK
jgi:Transposase domain (DUF772)